MKKIITLEVIMGSQFSTASFAGNQNDKTDQTGLAAMLLSILDKQKLVSEKLYLVNTHEVVDFCLS